MRTESVDHLGGHHPRTPDDDRRVRDHGRELLGEHGLGVDDLGLLRAVGDDGVPHTTLARSNRGATTPADAVSRGDARRRGESSTCHVDNEHRRGDHPAAMLAPAFVRWARAGCSHGPPARRSLDRERERGARLRRTFVDRNRARCPRFRPRKPSSAVGASSDAGASAPHGDASTGAAGSLRGRALARAVVLARAYRRAALETERARMVIVSDDHRWIGAEHDARVLEHGNLVGGGCEHLRRRHRTHDGASTGTAKNRDSEKFSPNQL